MSTDRTVVSGESESRSFGRASGVDSSVSVSDPLRSSSQDSATGADLGLLAGFWGDFVESLSWERVVATSACLVRRLALEMGSGAATSFGRCCTGHVGKVRGIGGIGIGIDTGGDWVSWLVVVLRGRSYGRSYGFGGQGGGAARKKQRTNAHSFFTVGRTGSR